MRIVISLGALVIILVVVLTIIPSTVVIEMVIVVFVEVATVVVFVTAGRQLQDYETGFIRIQLNIIILSAVQ